jgi:hypothetical protein
VVERHLARDRGMKPFGRIQERRGAEPDQIKPEGDESDAERDAAHGSS